MENKHGVCYAKYSIFHAESSLSFLNLIWNQMPDPLDCKLISWIYIYKKKKNPKHGTFVVFLLLFFYIIVIEVWMLVQYIKSNIMVYLYAA